MAEIVRAVGLRGEVKLLLTGDFLEEVLRSRHLRRERGTDLLPATHRRHRWKGATVILDLEEIADRNAAEAAVGERIGFRAEDYDREDFPRPASPAPFLYHGLTVVTVEGSTVGTVADVMVMPANLVLRVRQGEQEVLVPVIPPVVEELDREGQRLVIRPIPGLLDDDAEVV